MSRGPRHRRPGRKKQKARVVPAIAMLTQALAAGSYSSAPKRKKRKPQRVKKLGKPKSMEQILTKMTQEMNRQMFGKALKVEALSSVMRCVTFSDKPLKLQKGKRR